MELSEIMKVSLCTPESYLDFKQRRLLAGWIAQLETKEEMMKPKRAYWALSPTVDDERARELFELRFGKPPKEIKRYPKSVILLGPINEKKD